MNKQFVSDLKAGQKVESVFLLREKTLKRKKDGQFYLHLALKDKTGQIDGKMWENIDKVDAKLTQDDFVFIRGHIDSWRDMEQLIVEDMKKMDVKEISLYDYLPATNKDVSKIFQEIRSRVSRFGNEYLKKLLIMFLDDNDIKQKMMRAPAAQRMHSAYLGGLIEHIFTVMGLAQNICNLYEGVDLELVLAGVIFHDIGKIEELSYDRSIDFTDRGKLIGHLAIGLIMVDEKIKMIKGFPEELRLKLEHLIVSHHGEREWGSPKEPTTKEAIILHSLDNLDAKLGGFKDAEKSSFDSRSKWTVRSKMFGRELYKG